nr:ComEC/Rec2 family competence protein [Microcella alkalica]
MIEGADALRERFLDVAVAFPGPGAALLPGLAIGDTSAVDAELDEAMKRSSLSHLTAVSGANCAIVVGLVLGLGALARWPRGVRIGIALAALGGFVVLVTPQASVVRASVMAAVVLLALASGRSGRGLPVLGAAVLGILALDPWIARDYGFALSVLATGALLVLAGPLAGRLAIVMPRAIALWVAVPLAAQLACQPVLILLAPELPLIGVVANILAAPAAPVATIVGMAACLAAPVLPWLATALAAVAWVPASWIAGIAVVTSGLPGSTAPWPEGAIGALLLAGLTVGALVAAGIPALDGGRRLRARAALATASALLAVIGATAGADALGRLGRPADWIIAQCDVGQGDAVIVRSEGRIALTDTGIEPELLAECLDDLGIDRIDLLVLTHFDADHVGGVDAIVGRVDAVIAGPADAARDRDVLESLAAGGATVDHVSAGEAGRHGEYRWRALWPPDHRGVPPGNDASLVLEWRGAEGCRCPSLLALGDLGRGAQESLREAVRLAPVDVVKVGHHGSADQDPAVYSTAHAALGLIGVGEENTYGHPAAEALAMLADSGGAALRSDLHGLVLVAPANGRGDGWRVWTERGALAGPEEVGADD